MMKPTIFTKVKLLSVAVLFLSGCGVTPNHYVGANVTNKIDSVDVFVTIPQKEIRADVEKSNAAAAAGGGLLFALIDAAVENSRANTAEELIQPIKNLLVEFDFNQEFKTALSTELANVTWLKVDDIVLVQDSDREVRGVNYEDADAEAVLFVDAGYSVSADFGALNAWASGSILPKSSELKQFSEKPTSSSAKKAAWNIDNNIYRDNIQINNVIYQGADKEEQSKQLAEDSDKLIEQMRNTISRLAKAVAKSLTQNGQADNINKV